MADTALVVVEPTIISITMSLHDHILIADEVCLGTGSLAIVVFINLAVMGFVCLTLIFVHRHLNFQWRNMKTFAY